jgi:hemerythrin-like metal-binding protein
MAIEAPESADLRDLKVRLKTGLPLMDVHHERLIDLFHEATQLLRSDGDKADLANIINELIAYSMYHFTFEESLMEVNEYATASPETCAAHIRQHRVFAGKVLAFRDDLRAGFGIDCWAVVDFLRSWLVDHISTSDRAFAAFVRSRAKPVEIPPTP